MSVPRVARKRDGSVVRLDRFPLNALSLALLLGPPWPRAAVAHAVMMPLTAALEVGVIVVGSESTSSDRNQQGGMEMRPSTREAPSSLGRGDSNPTVLRPPAPQAGWNHASARILGTHVGWQRAAKHAATWYAQFTHGSGFWLASSGRPGCSRRVVLLSHLFNLPRERHGHQIHLVPSTDDVTYLASNRSGI